MQLDVRSQLCPPIGVVQAIRDSPTQCVRVRSFRFDLGRSPAGHTVFRYILDAADDDLPPAREMPKPPRRVAGR